MVTVFLDAEFHLIGEELNDRVSPAHRHALHVPEEMRVKKVKKVNTQRKYSSHCY
jgi:hypothetical protein